MTRRLPFRRLLTGALLLCLTAPAWTQDRAATSKGGQNAASLLPAVFAGWQKRDVASGSDAAQADPANAAVMKECGFTNFEQATYSREGRKIEVKAAHFADAGGAYGAFTFYRQPEMTAETIGDQAASHGREVLFYRGQVLVFARLDTVTSMSAAELRELSSELPRPQGTAGNLPTLLSYLPKPSLAANSVQYVLGPAALAQLHVPLSAEQVRFDQGAEVVRAQYSTESGPATLVLISYPTPQIAGERTRALTAEVAQAQAGGNGPRQAVRRSGPIVAFASGAISASDARSLVASVNYDATVTWNEATSLSKRDNVGSLIVAALALSGIVLLLALVAGIAFGGIRILMKRWFPDRVFDRSADVEIIQLNIRD